MTVKEFEAKLKRRFTTAEIKEMQKSCECYTEIHDIYLHNSDFHRYVDRICEREDDPLEFVLLKKTVQDVGFYYKDRPVEIKPTTEVICACEQEGTE